MKTHHSIFCILLLTACFEICGQETTGRLFFDIPEGDTIFATLKTTGGNEFTGIIVSEDEEFIEIETEPFLVLKIPKVKILSYKIIEKQKTVGGEFYFENPHATRYLYSPNGYGLRMGEGYYQNLWVMFNQVSYGFSDYFTMGTGITPLFLFEGAPTPVWITPKFSIPVRKDKINIGGGALLATVLVETDASFGIAFGTFTLGPRDSNFTLGTGWAFTSDGFAKHPTFTIAGMRRTGKKGYILTENYLISTAYETIGILSFGGRSVQKKLAVDYGLVIPFNIGATIAFPWLSITLPFGEKIN